MSPVTRSTLAVTAALWVFLSGASARGEEAVVPAVRVADSVRPGALGARAVDSRALAEQRGGSDAASLSDMKLNGVVTDNRASNLTTGNNIITDGALAGVSGVPLVVQNSGNNVLIQNATIINVQLK